MDRAAAKDAKVERLNALHEGNMKAIETRYGGRVADAKEHYDTTNGKWDAIQAEVDRQPRYARAIFYWPFMLGLMRLSIQPLPADPLLLLHLTLVALLMIVFPISKLMHAPGLFFSPTRHQADNPREARHQAAWAAALDKK